MLDLKLLTNYKPKYGERKTTKQTEKILMELLWTSRRPLENYQDQQADGPYQGINIQGPVPREMVKFNTGLSQISSMVFSSKNMQLEVTIYCLVFTTRYSNNNTKCYPKQCIGI